MDNTSVKERAKNLKKETNLSEDECFWMSKRQEPLEEQNSNYHKIGDIIVC